MNRGAAAAGRLWPYAAHLLPPLWLFWGPLFEGRVLFFRDLSFYYHPNRVFVASALARGVWPLWNPTSDAGAPFLMAYPVELLVLAAGGARAALALLPPLHVFLAMCGATRLARRSGASAAGGWAAGLLYGASGFLLSTVNLTELFHAAAWAPWVVAAILAVAEAASLRAALALAVVAAVQLSTLGAEVVLQSALAGLVLLRSWPPPRAWKHLAMAAALAAAIASPALLGAWSLLRGTARAAGFSPASSLAWSARGPVLLEAVLPRLFGNVHSFSEAGYWGQSFYPSGQPYLLSLYLGLGVLVLAFCAGTGEGRWRWWLLAGLGVALALGGNGPLAVPMAALMRTFRSPVKFALLADLSLCVLAGLGVDAVRRTARRRPWAVVPGLVLCAAGAVVWRWPELPARLLSGVLPALAGPQARVVAAQVWPPAFLASGALAVGAGLVLAFTPRFAVAAAVLAGLDLLAVNGGLNPAADGRFYELRPEVRSLLKPALEAGGSRVFAYGIDTKPPLRFRLGAGHDDDVWLYYLDRQSLLPRTHVLEGLEGAFDEDRVGWSPPGSTLTPQERRPERFRAVEDRLRLAGVRWILSFRPLPPDRVTLRGQAALPWIEETLGLYELPAAWPRAFWSPRADGEPEPGAPPVAYERPDPHTVRLRASAPPGFVIVLDGYDPAWHAEGPNGPLPVLRTHGRYWALPIPGGEQAIVVRYRPAWRGPGLAASLLGAAAAAALALRRTSEKGRERVGNE